MRLGRALFRVDGVKQVFLATDFVTIIKVSFVLYTIKRLQKSSHQYKYFALSLLNFDFKKRYQQQHVIKLLPNDILFCDYFYPIGWIQNVHHKYYLLIYYEINTQVTCYDRTRVRRGRC